MPAFKEQLCAGQPLPAAGGARWLCVGHRGDCCMRLLQRRGRARCRRAWRRCGPRTSCGRRTSRATKSCWARAALARRGPASRTASTRCICCAVALQGAFALLATQLLFLSASTRCICCAVAARCTCNTSYSSFVLVRRCHCLLQCFDDSVQKWWAVCRCTSQSGTTRQSQ